MRKLGKAYSMTRFKDLIEIEKEILNNRQNLRSTRLIDEEIFHLNDYEVKDLRAGLRENKSSLFNRAYKSYINDMFEAIYVCYVDKEEYTKLYDQCDRRSLLPELTKTIHKFDHLDKFKEVL